MSSPREPNPRLLRRLRQRLLAWYDANRRDLPWRDTGDGYRVLVSEFMLQQTRVSTVLPYFDRLLERFPDMDSLARATDEEVRTAWTGLGYYRRARSLHAAARAVVGEHGGLLPREPAELRELPGVGEYTAAALASIIHDQPEAVMDGNVIRVLTRLTADDRPVERAGTRGDLATLAGRLLAPDRAGDWNQAVMELGALVCTPRSPDCGACPWSRDCLAADGSPESYPVKKKAAPARRTHRAVGVFRRRGAVLLLRRNDPSLLDGTWELPGLDVASPADAARDLAADLTRRLGTAVTVGAEIATVDHSITTRRIRVAAFEAECRPLPRKRRDAREWVTEGEGLPMSSMTTKLLSRLASRHRDEPQDRN